LYQRLEKRANQYKNILVATFAAAGPKGYDIDAKAAVTVLVYERLRVAGNFSFAEGALRDQDIESVLAKVQQQLGAKAK
jgi:hypothetical protein